MRARGILERVDIDSLAPNDGAGDGSGHNDAHEDDILRAGAADGKASFASVKRGAKGDVHSES